MRPDPNTMSVWLGREGIRRWPPLAPTGKSISPPWTLPVFPAIGLVRAAGKARGRASATRSRAVDALRARGWGQHARGRVPRAEGSRHGDGQNRRGERRIRGRGVAQEGGKAGCPAGALTRRARGDVSMRGEVTKTRWFDLKGRRAGPKRAGERGGRIERVHVGPAKGGSSQASRARCSPEDLGRISCSGIPRAFGQKEQRAVLATLDSGKGRRPLGRDCELPRKLCQAREPSRKHVQHPRPRREAIDEGPRLAKKSTTRTRGIGRGINLPRRVAHAERTVSSSTSRTTPRPPDGPRTKACPSQRRIDHENMKFSRSKSCLQWHLNFRCVQILGG